MVLHDRFGINTSKIVHDTIDGEVIIINFDTGNYYSLNALGKDIWSCIKKNAMISEIVYEIVEKYNGNPDEIKEDITRLLADLEQEELIVLDKENNNKSSEENNKKIEVNKSIEKLKYEKPGYHKYTDMKEMLLLDPIHEVDETGWPASKIPSPKKD